MKKIMKLTLGLLLLMLPVTGCSASPQTSAESSGPVTLRVGTWNIAAKNHPDTQAMAELFARHHLDAVGIQEVDVLNDRNPVDMVQSFVNEDYPYAHFAKGRDFANGAFGVGILSRYEPLAVSSIQLESTGSRATKTLERVVIEKDGIQIALYNTHLSWENLDLRRRQIAQVIERVNADPVEYKIITADFNTDQHAYEYSMFRDNFNLANGYNGMWYDTYREGDNPSMQVLTIDNVLCTKNMRITDIQRVESELSDHDLFYAEFELLGEVEGTANTDNRALGQSVVVSSTNEECSPYLLVDYDRKTPWVSDVAEAQTITIELNEVIAVEQINVLWGAVRAGSYEVSGSLDGETFEPIAVVEKVTDSDAISAEKQEVKFVRLDLSGKQAADQGYEIAEIEIFGDPVRKPADPADLLVNGSFEEAGDVLPAGWRLKEEQPGSAALTAAVDTQTQTEGSRSLALTAAGTDGSAAGVLSTELELKPNTPYQLVFHHKAAGLSSDSFGLEMTQKTAAGEVIPTHQVQLNDNLCMSEDWAVYRYDFVTAYSASTLELSFKLGGAEGTLWLDDVQIREVTPVQNLFLSAEKSGLKPGETTLVTCEVVPESADDVPLHWFSSDESVAVVDEQGVVTAIQPGKAYIGVRGDSELKVESSLLLSVEK